MWLKPLTYTSICLWILTRTNALYMRLIVTLDRTVCNAMYNDSLFQESLQVVCLTYFDFWNFHKYVSLQTLYKWDVSGRRSMCYLNEFKRVSLNKLLYTTLMLAPTNCHLGLPKGHRSLSIWATPSDYLKAIS